MTLTQPDCRTTKNRHDGQRHFEARDGVGRPRLPVAAARHQVEQQTEQREDERRGWYRAENAQTLRKRRRVSSFPPELSIFLASKPQLTSR